MLTNLDYYNNDDDIFHLMIMKTLIIKNKR